MDGKKRRQKILIVDDSEMNRSILVDMLGEEYDTIEVENGLMAVSELQKRAGEISLMMLDIVMPMMDGLEVLEVMNRRRWIETVPVIMISAETNSDKISQALEMGVTDFISRPFDAKIVQRRVLNTLLSSAKQAEFENLVAEQIYEKEQNSLLMIDILSHIVEFKNGESGLHVVHVRRLTEVLLKQLASKRPDYELSAGKIALISEASALHDIGKIAIDEKILNKPGRLTNEEFQIMKQHSSIGAQMLDGLGVHQGEPLVRIAYQICRWHHERWDGRGYPDGLKGDDIPIAAQVVAMADVYDALTSERVYKSAFSHEKAIEMICNNECGSFNPVLLECLMEVSDTMQEELKSPEVKESAGESISSMVEKMSHHSELAASNRTLQLLEHERMKYSFFAAMSKEIQFEYTISPSMVSLNAWGARNLGLDEVVMDPLENQKVGKYLSEDLRAQLHDVLMSATPEEPIVTLEGKMEKDGVKKWYRFVMQALWSEDEPPELRGAIGKAVDIHSSRSYLENLERRASMDQLTGLLNLTSAQSQAEARLKENPEAKYALAFFDCDYFKDANNTYGHLFGNRLLVHIAERLRQVTRSGDIVSRAGGDEYIIFIQYHQELEPTIQRIYGALHGEDFGGFSISISMGIATTVQVGPDFTELMAAADRALYAVKQAGKGQYKFFEGNETSLVKSRGESVYTNQSEIIDFTPEE
ncbi:MAG: diguanylate cyclase [Acutalibacter sp.]|uniref:bifunctional diguanylate cyclase/phosphohydrolase n=1 Tax=Acutalibacter sp. TaxID=1918636 RepID=UPI002170096D|nr:diguanylate cyclase [Acutalibacter sp.]MCI9224020.1 diguanylate cyclase [Acutalibacter sp.]